MKRCRYLLLFHLLLVSGCAFVGDKPAQDYQTVLGNPHRDTEMAEAENARAASLLEKCETEEAEQALNKALIADVDYGPAHNNLGQIYFGRGEYYLAAWEFEYARRLMPNLGAPYNNLGLVFEQALRIDDAIAMFDEAVQHEPTNAEYIGNLARARMSQNDRDPLVRPLLMKLLVHDTRPQWTDWARETLALGKLPEAESQGNTTNEPADQIIDRFLNAQHEGRNFPLPPANVQPETMPYELPGPSLLITPATRPPNEPVFSVQPTRYEDTLDHSDRIWNEPMRLPPIASEIDWPVQMR